MTKRTFLRFPSFLLKAVTLSYDDGVSQDYRLIDIMKKNGLKGTFNINSGRIGTQRQGSNRRFICADEIEKLYIESGNEVAVHGEYHYSLDTVSLAVATNEVIADRKNLEKLLTRRITGMAYANGAYNDDVVRILEDCGIEYARTVTVTGGFEIPTDWLRLAGTCRHRDPKLMEYAKEFIEAKAPSYMWANRPKLFYLWGHSYEFDDDNNWNVIEEFCEYVGNRDDIWYATNGEIFNYVQAYDRLKYSTDGKIIYNPSAIDVYLCYFGQNLLVKAGETVKID